MSNNTHAVGQMQGYMIQVRHMLFELISLDDRVVSIEKLDDVAVEILEKSTIVEQLKSVTSGGNPTTDRSVVFWKTLYNWLNYVKEGQLVVDTTIFRMIVVSNHDLTIGSIIDQFHKALKKDEAREALKKARIDIWGEGGTLKNKVPTSYGLYLDEIFEPNNEDLMSEIVSKFELHIHENNYDENLIEKFSRQSIPPEFVDNLLLFMLGWVNDKVNEYIKNGVPAIIKSIEYREALVSQCRMYNQQKAIPTLSVKVTNQEVHTEVDNQDIYIRQLDLIQMSFDDKLDAASDYLQTKAETTIRAEKGLFTPQSSENYNDRLYRIWKSKRSQVSLLSSYSDVVKGQQLYAQLGEIAPQIDNELPSFFGSGTLQTLANEPSDSPAIGWHPNYKKRLKGDFEK